MESNPLPNFSSSIPIGTGNTPGFDATLVQAQTNPEVPGMPLKGQTNATGVVTYEGTGQLAPGDVNPSGGNVSTPIVGTPVTPVTQGTSDTAQGQVQTLQQDIQTATQTPVNQEYDASGVTAFGQQSQDVYKIRRDELAARRDSETQRIKDEFKLLGEKQAQQQTEETGATSTRLARMGGYLGEGSAGMQYEVGLEMRHRQEVRDLEVKRQNSLAQSQNAFNDGDFQLANAMLADAKDTEQKIYDRKNEFANQQAKMRDSQARAQEAERKAQQDSVKFALDYGIDKPYYSVDGQHFIDTATGLFVDPTDPKLANAEFQMIKKKPSPSDFMVVDLADGKYLMNKLTGEKQFVGENTANLKEVSVDNKVKLVNMDTGEVVAELGSVSYKPSSGGGGGSAKNSFGETSASQKQSEMKIETEANQLKRQLESGEIDWSEAWNTLWDKYSSYLEEIYPGEDINAMIDAMLDSEKYGWNKSVDAGALQGGLESGGLTFD